MSDVGSLVARLRQLIRVSETTLSQLPSPSSHTNSITFLKPPSLSSHHHHKQSQSQSQSLNLDILHNNDRFFYLHCPGPVRFHPTFTLPGILSIECADFSGGNNDKITKIENFDQNNSIRFLPSEFWFIKTEVERWNDYPACYSYPVLRAILYSPKIHEDSEFIKWVVFNSSSYGIVIDVPMRDHILLLFQLSFKAIAREAVSCADLVLVDDMKKLSPVAMSFNCPILVGAMNWLSDQLAVLYNEVDGKRFAINMLKQWILSSSKNVSLFLKEKVDTSMSLHSSECEALEPFKTSLKDEEVMGKSVNGETIFVSQVAAAVAALHERALLKVLSNAKPVPSYQRVAEHAYISKRADEERKKRSNYRPLLEYDGIVWHRPTDQEGNTTKTREELLAEERDYKRRRMSYRGKKLKRNATEVMRDIIDDCMDSIRQAGGIGCLAKVSDEAGKLFSVPSPLGDNSTDFGGLKKDVSISSTVTGDHFTGHKEDFRSHDDTRYKRYEDKPLDNRKQRLRDSSRDYEPHYDRRTVEKNKNGREWYSNSVERERSHGSGHRDDRDHSKTKRSRVSDYGDNSPRDRINYQRERGTRDSEDKDRRRKHSKRDHRADSVTSCVIEDRYNPYESRDMYDE